MRRNSMLCKKNKKKNFFLSNRLVWFDEVPTESVSSASEQEEIEDNNIEPVEVTEEKLEMLKRPIAARFIRDFLKNEEKSEADYEKAKSLFFGYFKHMAKTKHAFPFLKYVFQREEAQTISDLMSDHWPPSNIFPPYYQELFKLVAERSPFWMASYLLEYQDTRKNKEEIADIIIRNKPNAILVNRENYPDRLIWRKIIQRAYYSLLQKQPIALIVTFDEYKDQKYAKDLLTRAVVSNPYHGCLSIPEKVDDTVPYKKDLLKYSVVWLKEKDLKVAREKDPNDQSQIMSSAIQLLYSYRSEPYAEDVVTELIEAYPLYGLHGYNKLRYTPFAEKVCKLVIDKVYKDHPWEVLALYYRYQGFGFGDKENQLRILRAIHDESPVYFLRWYISNEGVSAFDIMKEIITDEDVNQFARERPDGFMQNYEMFTSFEGVDTQGIVLRISKKNPKYIFKNFANIAKEPFSDEALENAIDHMFAYGRKDIREFSEFYDLYKDRHLSEFRKQYIVELCLTYCPGVLLEFYETIYKDFGGAMVLKEAAEDTVRSAPTVAMEYYDLYKDLFEDDEAKELLERARKRKLVYDSLKRKKTDESKLMSDYGLIDVEKIERNWLPELHTDDQFGVFAALITRNLNVLETPINEDTVKAGYRDIVMQREDYAGEKLIQGRHVIVASHLEKYDDGKDRFGKSEMIRALKEQGPADLKHFEAQSEDVNELKKTKAEILASVTNSPSPTTFIFDGHGGGDAIYLSDGQIEGTATPENPYEGTNTIKITAKELADAVLKRDITDIPQDIFIFNGCYSYDFVENFYFNLRYKSVYTYYTKYFERDENEYALPIAIGVSEHGQLAYSDPYSPYGDSFFENALQLGDGHITTFEDLWESERKHFDNTSVFIPQGGRIQQVSKYTDTENKEGKADA